VIWHLVLMKPRADVSSSERRALVAAFERAVHEIPTVRKVTVGRRALLGAGYEQGMPDTGEYVIAIQFDDRAGLEAYLGHPAHEDLGVRFTRALASALIYDFEVGGMERLATMV